MESVSRSGRSTTTTELHHMSKKWKDPRTAERSPEHTKVWTEPPSSNARPRRVPVVYYLSRNGNLEHPHFLEVPLSASSDGLYLRDVIDRLNSLRGKGMAALYSWSSKRSYKNGFVWHDLAENDYIYPAHGQEYVLKGSELVVNGGISLSNSKSEAQLSIIPKTSSFSPESEKSGDDDFPVVRRRRNQSWSAVDLHEYKVYTGNSSSAGSKLAAASDASTQTDDKRRRRRSTIREENEIEEEEEETKEAFNEIESSEISPPPSDSSPETLESLMKADGKLIILRPEITDHHNQDLNPTAGNNNKVKASSVLMQLISCGSISCGPGKDNPGFSLISHYKSRMLPRGVGVKEAATVVEDAVVLRKNRRGGVKKQMVTEDKEYFSGSLIETKKEEFPAAALKRSNSYTGIR